MWLFRKVEIIWFLHLTFLKQTNNDCLFLNTLWKNIKFPHRVSMTTHLKELLWIQLIISVKREVNEKTKINLGSYPWKQKQHFSLVLDIKKKWAGNKDFKNVHEFFQQLHSNLKQIHLQIIVTSDQKQLW